MLGGTVGPADAVGGDFGKHRVMDEVAARLHGGDGWRHPEAGDRDDGGGRQAGADAFLDAADGGAAILLGEAAFAELRDSTPGLAPLALGQGVEFVEKPLDKNVRKIFVIRLNNTVIFS